MRSQAGARPDWRSTLHPGHEHGGIDARGTAGNDHVADAGNARWRRAPCDDPLCVTGRLRLTWKERLERKRRKGPLRCVVRNTRTGHRCVRLVPRDDAAHRVEQVRLQVGLNRPGDTAVVTLDGQRVPGVPANGGQFTISPVDRGTHSIQMVVQDSSGATVCTSPAVTFHVQQPSLQSPTRPIRPH